MGAGGSYYGPERAAFEQRHIEKYGTPSTTWAGAPSPSSSKVPKARRVPSPPRATVSQAPTQPQQPGALEGPGAMEKYWEGVQGSFAGHNPVPNYSADQYNRSRMRSPGLDTYYDKAHEIGSERIDRAMGARGLYGSTPAIEAQTDLASRLGAEQANREADFMLRQDAEQRMGAAAATQGGLGIGGQNLAYIMGGGQLAGAAQAAHEGRWNDRARNVLSGIMATMPGVQQGFENIFMQDQMLLDLINQGDIAGAQARAQQQKDRWDRTYGAIGTGVNVGRATGLFPGGRT